MTYMPVDEKPKCRFIDCVAGQGLAGRGICFLDGEWDNENCLKFDDEEEWLEAWRKQEAGAGKNTGKEE